MENRNSELPSNIPFVEKIANSIKQTGHFEKAMTGQDVELVMRGVISSLLSNQETVSADVSNMNVEIKNNQEIINGTVLIKKPISASIEIDCILENGKKGDKLALVSLDIKEKAGFIAKMALAAIDIEGKAREILQKPNKAIFDSLSTQLEPKGISLINIGLQFMSNSLNVSLSGNTTDLKEVPDKVH